MQTGLPGNILQAVIPEDTVSMVGHFGSAPGTQAFVLCLDDWIVPGCRDRRLVQLGSSLRIAVLRKMRATQYAAA